MTLPIPIAFVNQQFAKMHFVSQLAALALTAATLAGANTMTFQNQDDTTRKVIITPTEGCAQIDSVEIEGHGEATIEFPQGWIGNAYSISEGNDDTGRGMLAEVTFQGFNDQTYFDVSAIVDPNDKNGVKMMYPVSESNKASQSSFSGCKVFPCNSAYYKADDVQTAVTEEVDLIVTLGTYEDLETRDVEPQYFPRDYVLGKH